MWHKGLFSSILGGFLAPSYFQKNFDHLDTCAMNDAGGGSGPTGTAISELLVGPSTLDSLSEVESSRCFEQKEQQEDKERQAGWQPMQKTVV